MGTGLSDMERQHVKERTEEVRREKRAGKRSKKAEADKAAVRAKIEAMAEPDRGLAEQLHRIITSSAPELAPKLWYGQPAYARKGKVVCFFRSGQDDGERYSTFGFTPEANLDQDGFWPTSFAVTALSAEAEEQVEAMLRRALV